MLPEQNQLDAQGNALLKELMRPGVKIEAIIPEDATAETLWSTLETCVQGFHLLESRLNRLKPIIGKILMIFRNKPSLYIGMGYKTFEDFRSKGVGGKLGLGRTTLWEAQVIANDWPQLVAEPDRYSKIGRSKLNILAKFSSGRDVNAESLLNMASTMTSTELREYSEQRGFITPGETLPATIVINCNADIYKSWKHLVEDCRIHSVVGSSKEGEILGAMIEEVRHTWLEEYEDKERERQSEIEARLNPRTDVADASAATAN